jgi:uncharacterized SAM-binding protein YcdF (DUF218 family)
MYVFAQEVCKPFPLLMWLTGVVLFVIWRRSPTPRRRWRPALALYAILFVSSLPVSVFLIAGWLEWSFPRVITRPEGTRAIVVLGGGVLQPREADDLAWPDYGTYTRTIRAYELYRDGPPCPIILSGGGTSPPKEPAGRTMAAFLKQMGVPETDLIIEDQSRTTAENAEFTAKLLKERELTDRVLLVSTATHLWRAEWLFRSQGITVTPAGCDYFVDQIPLNWTLLWPSGTAVSMNQQAWHEYLGVLWHWLNDRE